MLLAKRLKKRHSGNETKEWDELHLAQKLGATYTIAKLMKIIIPDTQLGFRVQHFKEPQEIGLTEKLIHEFRNHVCSPLMLDTSKTFEKHYHRGLFHKISLFDISVKNMLSLDSFLNKREFQVRTGTAIFEKRQLHQGYHMDQYCSR